MAQKIKKGDTVEIISGKDKGKRGEVIQVMPKEEKIIVRGANIVKRHQRPTGQLKQGGIIEKEAPLYWSKAMVVCPSCDKTTKISFRILEDGSKVRVCKKCGEIIDKK
ncbi:MAG: 50S ribosomal protein L24 [Thermotogaceae bacterium]|nr:50S ribosomal protein L24 [Thermotogaceae bacterium]